LRPDRGKMGPDAVGAKSDGIGNCPSHRVTGVACSHIDNYNEYYRGFQLANIVTVITFKRIIWPDAGFMVIMVLLMVLVFVRPANSIILRLQIWRRRSHLVPIRRNDLYSELRVGYPYIPSGYQPFQKPADLTWAKRNVSKLYK